MSQQLRRLGTVALATAAVFAVAPAAAADPALDVSVSTARIAAGGTQVVLTGSYACGPFTDPAGSAGDGVVDLTVTQPAGGGATTTGYGYLYLGTCDGTRRAWSAPVDAVSGTFARGRGQASGSGYVCALPLGGPCLFGSFGPTTVRVR